MTIEELPGTRIFDSFRIPLSDFIPQAREGMVGTGAVSRHPLQCFRNHPGFYLYQRFTQRFFPYLQAMPSMPSEEFLFVDRLKRDCIWMAAVQNFEGKNRTVPWWVIKPFLSWQELREDGPLLPSHERTPFFMEARDEKDERILEPVFLSLEFAFLHSEWRLNLLDTENGRVPCHEGQVFLSVA